jgi:preprotein translocase subunit SecF
MREVLKEWYYKRYKKLAIIPIILVILAIGVLFMNYQATGDIIEKDVSLTGGSTATIYTTETFPTLEEELIAALPDGDFDVRLLTEFGTDQQIGIVIEAAGVEADVIQETLEALTGLDLTSDNFSVEFVGSTLGESFYQQMLVAILLAFLFMALVVFATFRMPVPSAVVVFAAFADMVCTLAILSLLHIKISTAGIAALLLLIGYSIDTDILLTTKILKRRDGSVFERLYSSMKTGLTMSVTTISALTVGYFVSTSLVLQQMFLIIIIGLLFDVVMTYSMNAGVLVWYAKRKRGAKLE